VLKLKKVSENQVVLRSSSPQFNLIVSLAIITSERTGGVKGGLRNRFI